MPSTNRTRLIEANQTNSLRTTIPSHIVKQFDLKKGDEIEWSIAVASGKLTLKVNIHKQQIGKRG